MVMCLSGGIMNRRSIRAWAAAGIVAGASLITACGGGSGGGSSRSGEIKIPVLYVMGDTGGVGSITVGVDKSADGAVRVDFSEDEVTGLGSMMRASMWNAATIALILTGETPDRQFSFAVKGNVDGPSAGTVTTVGVLAVMHGDPILDNVAMTGTIQPDGTVGPVGGIPEKIKGAAEAGYKKIGIPLGMRNSVSVATGDTVDVISEGRDLGLEVVELANVYEAYEFMTGKKLAQLEGGSAAKLSNASYDRLVAKTNLMLTNYKESLNDISKVSDFTQSLLKDLLDMADESASRAKSLLDQGLAAGAFTSSIEAWGYARAVASAGEVIDLFLFESNDSAISRIAASELVYDKTVALIDNLKTFEPKSPSDASALMTAFANSIDALSLNDFAEQKISSVKNDFEAGSLSKSDAVTELLMPLIFNEFAAVQVDATKELFDAGRDLGTTEISDAVNLTSLGDLLRKGADANLAAFKSQIVTELAEKSDRSDATVEAYIADKDIDVALALNQQKAIQVVTDYMGEKNPATPYAVLGYGVSAYSRTAQILMKYASNGVVDEDLSLTGVLSEAALTSALDLGKAQLAANIDMLRTNKIEPSNEVGLFEGASVNREGSLSEKFDALGKYWSGFLGARVLAYLGGLQLEGLK